MILRLLAAYIAVTVLFALAIFIAAFLLGLAEMFVRWLIDVTVTGRRLDRSGGES